MLGVERCPRLSLITSSGDLLLQKRTVNRLEMVEGHVVAECRSGASNRESDRSRRDAEVSGDPSEREHLPTEEAEIMLEHEDVLRRDGEIL